LPPRTGWRRWLFRRYRPGIYRFPPDRAARVAVGTVAAELAGAPRGVTRVVLCCFSPAAADHHIAAMGNLGLV
jgi:O-acetyl-ADP-ribose deacetylase